MSSGRLSVVATPIGNLDDITLRALQALRDADVVLAEDTRRTRKLCAHHDVSTPLQAFHAHSAPHVVQRWLAALREGKHLALVSDAGTPLLSDPGQALVEAAAAEGVPIEPLPGPSAITAALVAAGLPFDAFRFVGFLPRSGKRRRQVVEEIAVERGATVLFEAPTRVHRTLRELAEVLGDERRVAVCRELTKLHEEVVRGRPAELARHLVEPARGEITLVVEGTGRVARPQPPSEEALRERIRDLSHQGESARDIARTLAAESGMAKRAIYARVQKQLDEEA